MKILWFFLLGLTPVLLHADPPAAPKASPVKIIFDTDMASDCDDCGALAMLNRFVDTGEADLLACVGNSRGKDRAVAASISVINTWAGHPGIPIGVYHGSDGPEILSAYAAELRDTHPHRALPDDQAPSATDVYRTALASAPDGSVTVVSVGFFPNLRELLHSEPDKISPLSGPDLIRAKVRILVVMGGGFIPGQSAREYNFCHSIPADTGEVIAHWPGPILFSGYEIGKDIASGQSLVSAAKTNPVRLAYSRVQPDYAVNGRPSWDLTAVLAAVRDPHLYWEISAPGRCRVAADGLCHWESDPHGTQAYLIVKVPPQKIAAELNDLLKEPAKPATVTAPAGT